MKKMQKKITKNYKKKVSVAKYKKKMAKNENEKKQ